VRLRSAFVVGSRQQLGLTRADVQALPIREELDALARNYHHLREEHRRARPEGSTRRRLEDRLLDVRERFERILEEWVPDEALREEWRRYLDHEQPEPSGPPAIEPVVFRGVSDVTGSVAELRGAGDELRVLIDGTMVERIVDDKAFTGNAPDVRFKENDVEFRETFAVSPESLAALRAFLERQQPPPWDYAQELLADGIIDVHLGLTPRGHRALATQDESA
jgi:hypothetical protein